MTQQTSNPNSILKDAREAKGITLDIVHEATKVPMDALKALEQGYSVRILTPFYYRGFIKIYAEFLGLDPNEVLKAYHLDKTSVKIAPVPVALKKTDNDSKQLVGSAKQKPARITQPDAAITLNWKPIINVIIIAAALFISFKVITFALTHSMFSPKVSSTKKASIKETKEIIKTVKDDKSAGKLVKLESASNKAELVLRANKDTFIQVKVDGKVVFAMTMQKGTMESWSANDEIILSGKNLYELDMEVNGRRVGSLSTIERRAHRVVINKDGLTVKK